MISKNGFEFGPFASASLNMDVFSSMYFYYLFGESVKNHLQLQRDVKMATEQEDQKMALEKKTELEYYEGLLDLTLSYNMLDELES